MPEKGRAAGAKAVDAVIGMKSDCFLAGLRVHGIDGAVYRISSREIAEIITDAIEGFCFMSSIRFAELYYP